jgi:thioredoxin 1
MNTTDPCPLVNRKRDLDAALQANDPVIALFYASWCPFCAKFLPSFQKTAIRERRTFLIVEDDQETLAAPYSVTVYPTVLYLEKGIVVRRLDGVAGIGLQEPQLAAFVSALPALP